MANRGAGHGWTRFRWIGRLICALRGHKAPVYVVPASDRTTRTASTFVIEACPRCGCLDAGVLRLFQ